MIHLERFSFTYAGSSRPALEDLTVHMARGEFVALVGPVNAGRTTLFRVLNGSAPTHFKGTYQGICRVGDLNPCEVGHIRMGECTASITGDPDSQIVSLTVEEEVGFALAQRGYDRAYIEKKVNESLKLVGLEGFQRRSTASLSGGQKQRLVIASALAVDPEVILLDECMASLDPKGARNLYNLLSGYCRAQEVTLVAMEKDLELVLPYADRIILMERGKILQDIGVKEVVEHTQCIAKIGVRVPAWMRIVGDLQERGILGTPLPATEEEAILRIREKILK